MKLSTEKIWKLDTCLSLKSLLIAIVLGLYNKSVTAVTRDQWLILCQTKLISVGLATGAATGQPEPISFCKNIFKKVQKTGNCERSEKNRKHNYSAKH